MFNNLNHLTTEQIDDLYQSYIAGQSVKILIAEHQLNTTTGNFINIFPLTETSSICPTCKVPLVTKRPSRTAQKRGESTPAPFCTTCNHTEYLPSPTNRIQHICHCRRCRNLRAQQRDEERQKKATLIKNHLGLIAPVSISNLSLRHALFLLSLIHCRGDEELSYFIPVSTADSTIPFFPTMQKSEAIIRELLDHQLIRIDLTHVNSYIDFNLFEVTDNGIVEIQNYVDLQTVPNVSLSQDGQLLPIADLWSVLSVWRNEWNHQILNIWQEIALDECLQFLGMQLRQYRILFTAEDKTTKILSNLLTQYSVAQIYGFIYLAAKESAAFSQHERAKGKTHVGNTVPGNIQRFADKCETSSTWVAKPFHRDSRTPRSSVSRVLFDSLLTLPDDAGFSQCPPKFWNSTLQYRFSNVCEEERIVTCPTCDSSSVAYEAGRDRSIVLTCADCGAIQRYFPVED